jgi:dienelactone hydrolase
LVWELTIAGDAAISRPIVTHALAELLRFSTPPAPALETLERVPRDGYEQRLVRYRGVEGDEVRAYLLVPDGDGPFGAVVAHHQHNSEWHLGKSEVAGLAGDPLQAFGPALARRGVVVLAPDAVAFEDRRTGDDGRQHFNAMAYRLVQGRLLMTTVLGDAGLGLAALLAREDVDPERVGAVGHSYGGSTTLFQAALDERVRFACASGAACTFRRRIADGTGIELAQIVPGIVDVADLDDLVSMIAPRPLLLVSAPEDPYSADADEIERAAAYPALRHARFPGGHPLTPERFDLIVAWVAANTA